MTDELLSSIIRLENEILEQLQIEQARADAWLERVRSEEQQRISNFDKEETEAEHIALEEARARADEEASAIESREAERCQRIESLDEKELVEVLRRHLIKVLPGRIDDCQDVQS